MPLAPRAKLCYASVMTGTRYFSTDTDEIRAGDDAPLRTRVSGPTVCGCGVELGPLDMPCCGWGAERAGAEQPRNSLALAAR
jgi:hypothetical protein